jgi:hypothetical protein
VAVGVDDRTHPRRLQRPNLQQNQKQRRPLKMLLLSLLNLETEKSAGSAQSQ